MTKTVRAASAGPLGNSRLSLTLAVTASLVAGPAHGGEAALRTVLFGSMEAGASVFSASGAKIAFDRFDRDGPVALVTAGAGLRREGGSRAPVLVRATALGAALGGYQWIREWGAVTVFAGPELSGEMLSGIDGPAFLPARFGLRLHGEVWARPMRDMLATATVIVGSARNDASLRLSWGHALFGAYLGPEAGFYGDETGYRKWSLGLHITDLAFGDHRVRISAGCQTETSHARWSPYLALAVWSAL